MVTLKALPDEVQMINGKSEFLFSETNGFVKELKKYSTPSSHYTVISIIGPQSSGKSYLLNTLFGTKFDVLNAAGGRKQTTKGIWIAKCVKPRMIIMDVEGMDGRERGDDTLFERRSALFSLAVSDVLLLNMWFNDIGRVKGASYGLLELIFKERVSIKEAPKTTVIILVRDYDYNATPTDVTKKDLERSIKKLWHKVHATTNRNMSDYIQVIVKDFPHKRERREFYEKSQALVQTLCNLTASGSLQQNHYAPSFAYSSQRIWHHTCDNRIISAADHKLAMSSYICKKIKDDILYSLDEDETEYRSLMSRSMSLKKFNTELQLFLKRTLTRYEKDTTAFDRNIRKEVRDKLEKKILQRFKQTFEDKIVRIRYEILKLAESNVRDQLRRLPVLNKDSAIGVLRPYLEKFDYNSSANVHPYFQEVLTEQRRKLAAGLTKIGEKKGNKILSVLRAAGVAWAFVNLVIGTAWAICTGDVAGAAMMYMNAIGGGGGGVRNIGYRVGGVSTQALLNS